MNTAEVLLLVKARDEATKVLQGIKGHAQALGGVMGGVLKMGALAAGGGLIAAGVAAFKFVGAASTLQESLSKVTVVFGKNSAEVTKWAAGSAKAFGQSRQQALEAAGTFGNLFTAMGLGQKESAGLSTKLVELASDFASFNNIGVDEALIKLRAGLVGETEPLRTLGVNLNAAAVEAYILTRGIAASKDEITDAMKVQARYALILAQSTNAQGDFARTSGGLANQQRILKAAFADVQAIIGTALLPAVTKLTKAMAEFLTDHQADIERLSQLFAEKLTGAVEAASRMMQDAAPTVREFAENLKGGFETIRPLLEWVLGNKVALVVALAAIGTAAVLAFTPITAPVLALTAALAGLVLAIGVAENKWAEWSKRNDEVGASVRAVNDEHSNFRETLDFIVGTTMQGLISQAAAVEGAVRGWGFGLIWLHEQLLKVGQVEEDVARFTADKLTPAFRLARSVGVEAFNLIRDAVNDLKFVFGGFGPILDKIRRDFDTVRQSVGWLADRIWQLIDAIKSIPRLPDLTPGFSLPSLSLPKLAAGTPFVPRDMLAVLHRGEAVIPAAQNTGGGNVAYVTINATGVESAEGIADVVIRRLRDDLGMATLGGQRLSMSGYTPGR